jgi:hypothetical protein
LADRQKPKGLYFHGTVVDAGYPPERIAKFREESLSDEDFRREYLAERVIDPRRAIVPEWKDEYGEIEPVRDEFFKFYQYVNAAGLGWVRLHRGAVDVLGFQERAACRGRRIRGARAEHDDGFLSLRP